MGTIKAKAIIDGAAFALKDAGNKQWSRAELLGYVNDGQRDICVLKGSAYTLNQTLQLAAGTKQAVPDSANAFVTINRNMGVNGSTPGRAPRFIPMASMNAQNPNWHTQQPSATVLEFTFQEEDPKHFYVSPPQPASGAGQVEVVLHGIPADLPNEEAAIVLDDIYKTALERYVLYRAYLKDGELQNVPAATVHRSEFLALLGAKDANEEKAGA